MANQFHSQHYFAPEIHSPLVIDQDETFALTMSNSNPLPPSATGKSPIMAGPSATNGSRARMGGTNIVSVEPPKQSDLQVPYLSYPFPRGQGLIYLVAFFCARIT